VRICQRFRDKLKLDLDDWGLLEGQYASDTGKTQAETDATPIGEIVAHFHSPPVTPSQPEKLQTEEASASPVIVETSKSVPPDGLFDIDGFRFSGVEVRFGRAAKQYRLVTTLWDAENKQPTAPKGIESVMEEIYGTGHDTSDATFRQLCSDVRRKLQSNNCPVTIDLVKATVRLRATT
jgi:hypothetical protein